jgi:hypothetical protein
MENLKPVILPEPKFENNKSLFEALQERKIIREISSEKLSLQII